MTLILSCLTHDWVVQICDRRLVFPIPNSKPKVADDNANKQVLFCGHFVFTYTGLGEIGNIKTDDWLSATLQGSKSIEEACNTIATKASEAFEKIPTPKPYTKIHEFVGVGWEYQETDLTPIVVRIANCLRDDDGRYLAEIRDEFMWEKKSLSKSELYYIYSAGQPLNTKESTDKSLIEQNRFMKKCFERGLGPQPVARLMADTVRRVASENEMVGKGLLIVSIPKNAVINMPNLVVFGTLNRNNISSLYISGESGQVVQYGPHWVCGEMRISSPVGGNVGIPGGPSSSLKKHLS